MVSFSCEVCNDTVLKKKLGQHQQRCYGAYFTCIDCSTTFQGDDHNKHTSCISEAEKYEKGLYKGKKKQPQQQQKQQPQQQQQKQEQQKEQQKSQPIKSKIDTKDDTKPVTKSEKKSTSGKKQKEDSFLSPFVNNSSQNLYKILKKASNDDNKKLKNILKNMTIIRVDDKLVVKEG
ncbi:uncharacterized protein KGF55_003791 [Candida pseudojiufengensis]|uniref:uncharacterized protein n=1 Tax=Candida pseudojiufengensis TaxID=497109 RepID=UPI002224834B|nr:uncharacterized protein KGF55_003791 [Candida pseudojiufengensis]KAI5961820.1 hypothetical protein KGF55_003791 [Candida pseudojiufengensis]